MPLTLRLARWLVLASVAAALLAVLVSLALAPSYIPSHRQEFDLSNEWSPEQVQAALAELSGRQLRWRGLGISAPSCCSWAPLCLGCSS